MQDKVIGRLTDIRSAMLAGFDVSAWVVGYFAMASLQVAVGYSAAETVRASVLVGLVCGLTYVAVGLPLHLHHGRSKVASFQDAVLSAVVGVFVGLAATFANLYVGSPTRISITVTGSVCAMAMIFGGRALYRFATEWNAMRAVGGPADEREPVVVIGAGNGATQLVADMATDPACPWRVVAVVDDDPRKRRRRLNGVQVMGAAYEFGEIANRLGARTAIMAMPSAPSNMVRVFNRIAVENGIDLKVVPSVSNLSNPAHVEIADVRDIDVTDFLGRPPIDTDVDSIASYITGKRVLVTGAGGSIGSELCRQISRFGPSELIMLDRDESALHAVQLSISGRALLNSNDTELGDIRDARYVTALFARRQPHVVFHAAALKHLPLLEASPGEAFKTNVVGTQNVLDAAVLSGVERFVNVSTDKAANPCSVLGYSKRVAEGLTAAAARTTDGSYMSVRFGNVLGSRGSVLTTFTAQIAAGGPVTVTDPRVTRYFMTIREAVQLVIQAGAIGARGDVMVLDMGEPIAIKDVAEQLIDLSGKPIDIVYTGLREGEKMDEELFGDGETDVRPSHELISQTPVPPYAIESARHIDPYASPSVIARGLSKACDDMAVAHARMIRRGTIEPDELASRSS